MTEVVFETASFAAAFAKAAAIAPTTGQAFDQANGIVLEVLPEQKIVVLKCTNLDVYYMEWLTPLEVTGERAVWRVPARVFAGVIGTLPIGSGKKVKFSNVGDTLHLESGRTKLKRQLINVDNYPEWGAFNPDELETVPDFSGKYERIVWAASKNNDPPFTGIFYGNGILAATDRYKIASVPVATPFEEPLVIQAVTLGALIKPGMAVRLGRGDSQLFIEPDSHSQVRVGLLGVKYPSISRITRRDHPQELSVGRDDVAALLARAKHVVGNDRALFMSMIVGREELAFMVNSDDNGMFGDVVEVVGCATHKRVIMKYNQNNLAAAIGNSPHELIKLCYDPDNMQIPLRVYSGSEDNMYEAWIAPIKADTPE